MYVLDNIVIFDRKVLRPKIKITKSEFFCRVNIFKYNALFVSKVFVVSISHSMTPQKIEGETYKSSKVLKTHLEEKDWINIYSQQLFLPCGLPSKLYVKRNLIFYPTKKLSAIKIPTTGTYQKVATCLGFVGVISIKILM